MYIYKFNIDIFKQKDLHLMRNCIKIWLRSKKGKVKGGKWMARLSDVIEQFIKAMFEDNDEQELQIQRNELANHFSCAPSQINYVLTTRFTSDRGYYIESRRGGGGYITIKHVELDQNENLERIINTQIGSSITYDGSIHVIDGLLDSGIVTEREAVLMKAALNDRGLALVSPKNKVRAEILKAMLMAIL